MREQFSRYVGPVIDKVLGLRCTSFGYQYSEIAGSLASVYFCGGDCVEDVTSHLMPHLSLHPALRTCSSDTILRAIIAIKSQLINHFSRVTYYRYRRGEYPITPKIEQKITEVCRECGWTAPLTFDTYSDELVW